MLTNAGRASLDAADQAKIPLERAVCAAMLAGRELSPPVRVRPEQTVSTTTRTLTPHWPDGTVLDTIGVAAEPDGPILVIFPVGQTTRTEAGDTFAIQVPAEDGPYLRWQVSGG